ncbi:hypothetical protein PV350_44595 [Streptomyces sp. PA03-6a]|nr:hypothetical protein [Streptomyces sp. PA03-6a]
MRRRMVLSASTVGLRVVRPGIDFSPHPVSALADATTTALRDGSGVVHGLDFTSPSPESVRWFSGVFTRYGQVKGDDRKHTMLMRVPWTLSGRSPYFVRAELEASGPGFVRVTTATGEHRLGYEEFGDLLAQDGELRRHPSVVLVIPGAAARNLDLARAIAERIKLPVWSHTGNPALRADATWLNLEVVHPANEPAGQWHRTEPRSDGTIRERTATEVFFTDGRLFLESDLQLIPLAADDGQTIGHRSHAPTDMAFRSYWPLRSLDTYRMGLSVGGRMKRDPDGQEWNVPWNGRDTYFFSAHGTRPDANEGAGYPLVHTMDGLLPVDGARLAAVIRRRRSFEERLASQAVCLVCDVGRGRHLAEISQALGVETFGGTSRVSVDSGGFVLTMGDAWIRARDGATQPVPEPPSQESTGAGASRGSTFAAVRAGGGAGSAGVQPTTPQAGVGSEVTGIGTGLAAETLAHAPAEESHANALRSYQEAVQEQGRAAAAEEDLRQRMANSMEGGQSLKQEPFEDAVKNAEEALKRATHAVDHARAALERLGIDLDSLNPTDADLKARPRLVGGNPGRPDDGDAQLTPMSSQLVPEHASRTLGMPGVHELPHYLPQAQDDRVLASLARNIEAEFGIRFDSIAGIEALPYMKVRDMHIVRSLRPGDWQPSVVSGLHAALRHYAPILGERRRSSSRGEYRQEVRFAAVINHSLRRLPDFAGYGIDREATAQFCSVGEVINFYDTLQHSPVEEIDRIATGELARGLLRYKLTEFGNQFWNLVEWPSARRGEVALTPEEDFVNSFYMSDFDGPRHWQAMKSLKERHPNVFRRWKPLDEHAADIARELAAEMPRFTREVGIWASDGKFIQAFQERPVTKGGRIGAMEDLIQTAGLYFAEQEYLRETAPLRAAFFDRLVADWFSNPQSGTHHHRSFRDRIANPRHSPRYDYRWSLNYGEQLLHAGVIADPSGSGDLPAYR